MLLQLAIDRPESIRLVPELADLVDIIEVGTPLLKRFGLTAISTLRELAPDIAVLVDTKTVDGGAQEAEMVFNAGAMFLTVLSTAAPATYRAVSDVAVKYGGHIVIDTLIQSDDGIRERPAYPTRFDYVSVHASSDARRAGEETPRDFATTVQQARAKGFRVCLAGGIEADNLASAIEAGPDVLVIGRGITEAPVPRKTTEWIVSNLPERGHGWPWPTK